MVEPKYPRRMVSVPEAFRIEWKRDREEREIAELESLAVIPLALQRGWPRSKTRSVVV